MRRLLAPSLARTLALQIVAMVFAVAICATAAVYTVAGLHQDFTQAQRAFAELSLAADLGMKLELARADLLDADGRHAGRLLDRAEAQAGGVRGGRKNGQSLAEMIRRANAARATSPDLAARQLADAKGVLAKLNAETRDDLLRVAANEEGRRAWLGWIVGVVTGLAVLIAAAVGIAQYRAVMRPTRALSAGVTAFAAGDFSRRLATAGPREFARLAGDFNRMAAELERLYRDLEEQVAVKSRQLALSQRLASVGYLAAGVSHEINNPLAIIAAAAERARRMLERSAVGGGPSAVGGQRSEAGEGEGEQTPIAASVLAADRPPPTADSAVIRAFSDIIDESFRCKAITDKLLALSRPTPAGRRAVAIGDVSREVVESIQPLPAAAGRTIRVIADESISAVVDESEFRQLLLNLLTNALDATADVAEPRIDVIIGERDGVATMEVSDNGRGIAGELIDKMFEPFVTAHRPGSPRGTGLGLSIAHAIARAAGGDLTATSGGAGEGSRFMLTLPTASNVPIDALR